jgi:uncharacterized membrane protein YdjX (TVP38/TMEM64 family)
MNLQYEGCGGTSPGSFLNRDSQKNGVTSLQRYRFGLLILLFLGLWLTAWATGANRLFDAAVVRALIEKAGVGGLVVFVLAFAIGQLLRIPGPVFVAIAILVYGRPMGTFVAVLGALVSVNVSFVVVRTIAGMPLTHVQRPFLQRLLRRINQQPLVIIATLRLIFQTAPPLNYALAMTGVRFRDHLIGSALGLPLPIAATALALDWLIRRSD